MDKGGSMRAEKINYGLSERDIYNSVREFILMFTDLPVNFGNQNGPLDEDSVVITKLYQHSPSLPSTTYDSVTKTETSRRTTLTTFQVDIYGKSAGQIYDAIVVLGMNPTSYWYASEDSPNVSLAKIVERGRVPFVNEQANYENRYMLEMEFSIYNEVSRTIEFIESINVKTIEVK